MFARDSFNVICSITDAEGKSIKNLFSHNNSSLGCKILEGFFNVIKGEALKNRYFDDNESEFDRISEVLYQKFKLENLSGNKSLEEAIEDLIVELKHYEYYIPKEIVGDNKEGLTPLEIDYYLGSFDALISLISKALKILREEKISFWTKLFNKYREDKDAFDYEFKMSKLRTKEMEERISKITSEDFKDLL
jgi:hypothetical protein